MTSSTIAFEPTGEPDADELVRRDPLALLIGMLLDQQISIELAFKGPWRLQQRLGHLDAAAIAAMPAEDLAAVFAEKPALHRFPASMATRTQALCAYLCDHHGGSAGLWLDEPTTKVLGERLEGLPGFGQEKTMILAAVLGKRFGVRPRGWKRNAGVFADREPRSVADMDSETGRERVKQWKAAQRAAGRSKQD